MGVSPPGVRSDARSCYLSFSFQNENVLVVGGGDTAAEYVQYLRAQVNRVTLSYRQAQSTRLSKQSYDTFFQWETVKKSRYCEALTSNRSRMRQDARVLYSMNLNLPLAHLIE
ncbi:MAG: hypothetical protein QOF72_1528 [Blastocatellia bacterium]|nr:hypothetical protein [Blastocatellia bacterium]